MEGKLMEEQREILNQMIASGADQDVIVRQSQIMDEYINEFYKEGGQA
jgi:hypothetical protein